MTARIVVGACALVVCIAVAPRYFGARQPGVDPSPPNATGQVPAFAGQTRALERKAHVAFDVVTVAEKLRIPGGSRSCRIGGCW